MSKRYTQEEKEYMAETDNVRYRRDMYYLPSTGKTYLGKLPADVEGKGG